MGAGQSKGDNYHKWSYPFHAFWCCVGTAIESFAKLADSIYFHADPETPVRSLGQQHKKQHMKQRQQQ